MIPDSVTNVGLALMTALVPSAGYAAVVVNTVTDPNPTGDWYEVAKLGLGALLVFVVTAPMVKWILSRLDASLAEQKKLYEDLMKKATSDETDRKLQNDIQATLHRVEKLLKDK